MLVVMSMLLMLMVFMLPVLWWWSFQGGILWIFDFYSYSCYVSVITGVGDTVEKMSEETPTLEKRREGR